MSQVYRHSLGSLSTQVEGSVPALVYPYRAGLTGGALGGIAMIAVAVAYGLLSGHNIALEILGQTNAATLLGGLLLHAAIAMGLGFVFAVLLPTLPGSPMIWSLTLGPLLWWLAGSIALPMLALIWIGAFDMPMFLIAHLAYGLVLGGCISRTPKIRAE